MAIEVISFLPVFFLFVKNLISLKLCVNDYYYFSKPGTGGVPVGGKSLNYDEVFRQSSPTNTTVYIGGTTSSDETVIRHSRLFIFIS